MQHAGARIVFARHITGGQHERFHTNLPRHGVRVSQHARQESELTARAFFLVAALGLAASGRGAVATAPEPSRASFQLFLVARQSNMAGRGVVEDEDRVENPRVLMFDRLESWETGTLDRATHTHPWDEAIARTKAAMKDGVLKAILWHQGESDSNAESALLYEQRLRALIERFRSELGNPTLPFLIGQLGRFDGKAWDAPRITVDSVHRALAAQMPNVAFVSSEGLKDKGDNTHFTAEGARELGRRYADAYLRLVQH